MTSISNCKITVRRPISARDSPANWSWARRPMTGRLAAVGGGQRRDLEGGVGRLKPEFTNPITHCIWPIVDSPPPLVQLTREALFTGR